MDNQEIVFLLRLIAFTLLVLTALILGSFIIWIITMPSLP